MATSSCKHLMERKLSVEILLYNVQPFSFSLLSLQFLHLVEKKGKFSLTHWVCFQISHQTGLDCKALYETTRVSLPLTTQTILSRLLGPWPRWDQTPLQHEHGGQTLTGRITGPNKRLTVHWVCACAPLAPLERKLPNSVFMVLSDFFLAMWSRASQLNCNVIITNTYYSRKKTTKIRLKSQSFISTGCKLDGLTFPAQYFLEVLNHVPITF